MTTPLSDRPTHVTSSYTSSAGTTGRPSDTSHTTAANNNSSQQTTGLTDDSGATSVTGQHSTSGNPAPTTTPTSTGESVTLLRVYSQLLIPVVSVLLYGAQGWRSRSKRLSAFLRNRFLIKYINPIINEGGGLIFFILCTSCLMLMIWYVLSTSMVPRLHQGLSPNDTYSSI